MNKNILKSYIYDRKGIIFLYSFSSVSLIFYFNMITPDKASLVYPLLFSIFILITYLVIDGTKYIKFNQKLFSNLEGIPTDLYPSTYEQQMINRLLVKISTNNSHQYQQLKDHHRENLYFLSHLMHHLKAPLSVIEIILSDEYDESVMDSLLSIQDQTNRIRQTVDQALALVRTDAFENDLSIQPVDLILVLQQSMNEFKKECIQYNIYPKINCQIDRLFVITDEKWCKVLLQQLISNAIKYSALKEGNKQLRFTIEYDHHHVCLYIIDEGIGIPDYDQNAVFQPFFTGENGRKVTQSSGIGLYLCQKLCNRLDHELSFTSKQNQGTTFTVKMKISKYNPSLTNL